MEYYWYWYETFLFCSIVLYFFKMYIQYVFEIWWVVFWICEVKLICSLNYSHSLIILRLWLNSLCKIEAVSIYIPYFNIWNILFVILINFHAHVFCCIRQTCYNNMPNIQQSPNNKNKKRSLSQFFHIHFSSDFLSFTAYFSVVLVELPEEPAWTLDWFYWLLVSIPLF